jgi:hypothetical protein
LIAVTLKPLTNPTLAIVAVVYGFALTLAFAAGLFGLLLAVLVLLSLCRYGYEVLRNHARGRNRDAAPDLESMNPVGDLRVVLHSMLFVMLWVWAAVAPLVFSAAVTWSLALAALLLGVAYPASAACLALTGDLPGALNPRNVLSLIRTLGRDYAWLVAACLGLFLAAGLADLLPVPWFLSGLVGRMLAIWVVLGVFALTGGELREHRERFEIPGELEPEAERQRRLQRSDWQKRLDLAYASLRSGLKNQGYAAIAELVGKEGGSLEVQQWIFEQMLTWEDRSHALAFAHRLIDSLLACGEQYEALEMATRCRRFSPAFELRPPAAGRLAEFARSIGRHGIADELAAAARPADAV